LLRYTLFPYTTLFRSQSRDQVIPDSPMGQGKILSVAHDHGPAAIDPLSSFRDSMGRRKQQRIAEHFARCRAFDGDGGHRILSARSEEHTSELQSRENL